MITLNGKIYQSSIEITLGEIGGKWKTAILWNIRHDKKRFAELKKLIPKITQKMLTQQLKALEKDNIVNRKVYAQMPPKVEYSLTPYGKKLKPLLEILSKLGDKRIARAQKISV